MKSKLLMIVEVIQTGPKFEIMDLLLENKMPDDVIVLIYSFQN